MLRRRLQTDRKTAIPLDDSLRWSGVEAAECDDCVRPCSERAAVTAAADPIQCSLCQITSLFRRQLDSSACDRGLYLTQTVFVYGLGKNIVSLTKWVDRIDQIDVQVTDIRDVATNAVDERRVGPCGTTSGLSQLPSALLNQIQRRDRSLANRFLIQFG